MERDQDAADADAPGPHRGLPLASVVRSVLAAAFGVQSNRNKERDFSQGNYRHFIVAGLVFTILFVLTLVVVVQLVLGGAR
jgi:hypothetical protein